MIDLCGSTVFVTGGAGVIGRQMVDLLLDLGATVHVGDLKPCPESWNGRLSYREGDLNSFTLAEFVDMAPDVMIHLAATFERSVETPGFWEENFQHNVRLSHHLMGLARSVTSLRRVVFASTYLCYEPDLYLREDGNESIPAALKEGDAVRPRNLVGMAKFSHEKELAFLHDLGLYPFSYAAARIFRGYGVGSRDYISRTVRGLLNGEPITAFRVDGEFDYVFGADSADGLIRLAAADDFTGIVNLGTGRRRSVSDVFEILRRHFPDMELTVEESDLLIESSEADVTLLTEITGWRPPTSLEDGIAAIVRHERSSQGVTLPD